MYATKRGEWRLWAIWHAMPAAAHPLHMPANRGAHVVRALPVRLRHVLPRLCNSRPRRHGEGGAFHEFARVDYQACRSTAVRAFTSQTIIQPPTCSPALQFCHGLCQLVISQALGARVNSVAGQLLRQLSLQLALQRKSRPDAHQRVGQEGWHGMVTQSPNQLAMGSAHPTQHALSQLSPE